MSEEVIDRVDELIRKNNIRYKDEQSQKAYERALQQYEKQSKLQQSKQYAALIKQGNRKAIEKAKSTKREEQLKRKRKKKAAPVIEQAQEEVKMEPKKRMSEAELTLANKTIEARAERLIQQQQLEKLNQKLQEQKKRTKLFELNEKCKNIAKKSTEKTTSNKNIEEGRMGVLKSLEQKAHIDIAELDGIINGLSQQLKNGKPKDYTRIQQQKPQELHGHEIYEQQHQPYESLYPEQEDSGNSEREQQQAGNPFNLNTLIFQKSSEELLQMDYIPI